MLVDFNVGHSDLFFRKSVLFALMISTSTAPHALFLTYHPKFFSAALLGALLPPKTLTSQFTCQGDSVDKVPALNKLQ